MALHLDEMPVSAKPRVAASHAAARLSPAIAAGLKRIPRRWRTAATALAREHERYADLALSFPAALLVLSTAPARRTAAARTLVVEGASLKAVAAALGMPMWLRHLPPEACSNAVRLPLPHAPDAARSILNHIPADVKRVPVWLNAVGTGYSVAGEAFAVWLARETARFPVAGYTSNLVAVGVWAWYCEADRGPASRLVTTRWDRSMALPRAARAARDWYHALEFELCEPPRQPRAMPPADAAIGGYTFHELAWGRDFAETGTAMSNCLATFAGQALGGSRVFVIRQGGRLVAAMDLDFGDTRRGVPRLDALYGPRNETASDEVWWAAYQWLSRWDLAEPAAGIASEGLRLRLNAWHDVWRPYWQARRLRAGVPQPVGHFSEPDLSLGSDLANAVSWLQPYEARV